MSMDTPEPVQSDPPRQRRIQVEDILDGLIARASRALAPDAGGATPPEVAAQAQQVVQLAQQLKDALGQLRQLDPMLLAENRAVGPLV